MQVLPKVADGLLPDRFQAWCVAHPRWALAATGDKITASWAFTNFMAALAFVNQVAACAEAMDHHPDIHIHYNQVQLVLWSHDKAGLTPRDLRLAEQIDGLPVDATSAAQA